MTSINDTWRGTFHLHEFLQATSPSGDGGEHWQQRHPHGRLPECVTDGRTGERITPREAESRAGKVRGECPRSEAEAPTPEARSLKI